jgi:hypothetical protein
VIECLTLLLAVLRAALRDRSDLLTECLLLRHLLAVLTRPTRRRPRLRTRDRLLCVLARRLRNECLDRVIPLNAAHLRAVLAEFVGNDNAERPHRSLSLAPPLPPALTTHGPVRARPVLGGLRHVYRPAA